MITIEIQNVITNGVQAKAQTADYQYKYPTQQLYHSRITATYSATQTCFRLISFCRKTTHRCLATSFSQQPYITYANACAYTYACTRAHAPVQYIAKAYSNKTTLVKLHLYAEFAYLECEPQGGENLSAELDE